MAARGGSQHTWLGRAVDAPPRRAPIPAPYGPSFVRDSDSAPPPWAVKPPAVKPPAVKPSAVNPSAVNPTPHPRGGWFDRPAEDRLRPSPLALPRPPRARSSYDALESHGRFHLIDTGELVGGARLIVLRLPRRTRGCFLDPRVGEVICANSARGGHAVGGRLDVQFVTRHKYFPSGRAVTSCVVGVPDEQWRRLFA